MDPLRLRVLKKLTDALLEITPANGYAVDLTGAVFRGRDVFGDKDPLPMVSILEAVDSQQNNMGSATFPINGRKRQIVWPLLIQGWVEDDLRNPTDPVYVLQAEVMRRLAEEQRKEKETGAGFLGMGNVITAFNATIGTVRPADSTSSKAFFWCKLEISLLEDIADPYA